MNVLKCKITQLAETIWPLVAADVPVCVTGPTGVGKSAVTKNDLMPRIVNAFGPSVLHDVRLSTKDIVDGTGMPIIDREAMATLWTRPAFIPADDGKMHIMFYDEFGHAPVPLQQMAYSLVLDRGLGGYNLPVNNRVILASNTREDGGGDNKMLRPLQNRMAHIQVEVDVKGFQEKIREWGWNPYLIAFLQARPALIYDEDAAKKTDDPAFPTPRSLEAFNKALKVIPGLANGDKKLANAMTENSATAICGPGFSRQYLSFISSLDAAIPRMAQILANPGSCTVPKEHQHQWVVAGAIAKNVDAKTTAKYAEYLARLSPDIRAHAAHDAIQRDPLLANDKNWKALLKD